MTNLKISELDAAAALDGSELVPVVQDGETVQTTVADIAAAATATPGGLTTQVQFNDAGAFGGDAEFTWDKTNNILTIGNLTTGATIRSAPVSGSSTGVRMLLRAGDSSGLPGASGGALDLIAGNSVSSATGAGGAATLTAGNGITGGDATIKSGAGNASTGGGGHIKLSLNATGANKGNIYTRGTGVELATNATGGFFEIPSCNGTPTGTPDLSLTGNVPMVYDRSAHKLWVYSGSWRSVALT
jgi:hypothetical protein